MVEAPTFAPEAKPEAKPFSVENLRRSFTQFTTDLAQANADARRELGTTAVGHMLSGAAPLAIGIVGEVASDALLSAVTSPRMEAKVHVHHDRDKNTISQTKYNVPKDSAFSEKFPFLTENVLETIQKRPLLKELVENIGITVLYNNILAKPSQGALPSVGAVDLGVSLGIDVGAHGVHKLFERNFSAKWRQAIKEAAAKNEAPRLAKRKARALQMGESLLSTVNFSNGPTILGIRMIGEGIGALVGNYAHIQKSRKDPNYVRPRQERRYPERRDFRKKNEYQNGRGGQYNRRMYVGQGSSDRFERRGHE